MGHKLPVWFLMTLCGLSLPARAQDAGVAAPLTPAATNALPTTGAGAAGAGAGDRASGGAASSASPADPSERPVLPESRATAPANGPDLSVVRSDLASVMDELIAARTRVSVLTKALFNTPLSIRVVRRADDQRLEHITLRLDGVPVHDSDGAVLARDEAELFQGFAAPGVHEVAVEITEVAKANADYRYVRSERFQIEIKKGMRTRIEFVLRDKSDMAEELREDDEGEYDVRTLMRVEAKPVKDD